MLLIFIAMFLLLFLPLSIVKLMVSAVIGACKCRNDSLAARIFRIFKSAEEKKVTIQEAPKS